MDHASLMRVLQRLSDLPGDGQCLFERYSAGLPAFGRPRDELLLVGVAGVARRFASSAGSGSPLELVAAHGSGSPGGLSSPAILLKAVRSSPGSAALRSTSRPGIQRRALPPGR